MINFRVPVPVEKCSFSESLEWEEGCDEVIQYIQDRVHITWKFSEGNVRWLMFYFIIRNNFYKSLLQYIFGLQIVVRTRDSSLTLSAYTHCLGFWWVRFSSRENALAQNRSNLLPCTVKTLKTKVVKSEGWLSGCLQ